MERTFHITKKIEATKEQWDILDALVENAKKADKNGEIASILIDLADVKNGVLSERFVPIIETFSRASAELEEAVVFDGTIDWVTRKFPIGYETVSLWRREGC